MKTYEYYDYNVYGDSDNSLHLTAYEWEYGTHGELQMNSSKYYTIRFEYPQHREIIEFLLGDLWINHYPLTDYDEWRDLDEVYNAQSPQVIKDFIENLPTYELKKELNNA